MHGRLILIRHGQSEANAQRCFPRSDDTPLTERGRAQARAAAEQVSAHFEPVRLIASPLYRAQQTAAPIAETLGLGVELDARLAEQSCGELRGQPYATMLEAVDYDPQQRWRWTPPGGESLFDVQARAVPCAQRAAAAHPDEDVVLISHHGTILALWAWACGSWEGTGAVRNGSFVCIAHDGERFGEPVLFDAAKPGGAPS